MMSKKILSALLAATALTAAAPALADNDEQHYRQNRNQYISHKQAAKAAVAYVGGGVAEHIDFEYSTRKGAYFEVEVRSGNGREYDVKVDARSGKVTSAKAED